MDRARQAGLVNVFAPRPHLSHRGATHLLFTLRKSHVSNSKLGSDYVSVVEISVNDFVLL